MKKIKKIMIFILKILRRLKNIGFNTKTPPHDELADSCSGPNKGCKRVKTARKRTKRRG